MQNIKLYTARKFYIRKNKNEVISVETGRTVIAHLFPLSTQIIF